MMRIIKNWIAISFWICTCLFAGFLTKAETIIVEEKADSLMLVEAALKFERAYFFSVNTVEKNAALFGKSMCLKQIGEYKKAAECLQRVDLSSLNDSSVYIIRHQMALCYYLSGDFSLAESHLLQLFYYISDSSVTYTSLPLFALTLNELRRWQEAKHKILDFMRLSKFEKAMNDSLLNIIEKEYEQKNYPKLKNPERAVMMSSIIPGLGQVYAGYFWEGFANASLQLISLAFTGGAIYLKYYITSFMVGYTTFYRFYRGGQNRAEFLANKSNYEKTREYNSKLKKVILPCLN